MEILIAIGIICIGLLLMEASKIIGLLIIIIGLIIVKIANTELFIAIAIGTGWVILKRLKYLGN